MSLSFITENSARQLLDENVARHVSKGFIQPNKGFTQHCIDTGRIAYEVANKIRAKHPSLASCLNPDELRVEGYMHDFSKPAEGVEFHEIGAAHQILRQGARELGLVTGGTESQRVVALRGIASLVPPDFALFESLGGRDYPNNSAFPNKIEAFRERVEELRRELVPGKVLTVEELALPLTLAQQVALYADLTNLNGKAVSVESRITELEQRYATLGRGYNPVYAELARKIRPRILTVSSFIDGLLNA
jgi:hypothetical protein